ncbi:MAG: spiro-SPASM protein [Treponema sp.]|jgi:spiro-SPASM protein|nr:spiro-SPASM protein [Treponema sp.]
MNVIAVLYGGALREPAYKTVFHGKSAFDLTLDRVRLFPAVNKVALLAPATPTLPLCAADEVILPPNGKQWTRKQVLNTLASLSEGFDYTYYAWADCPFLDAGLASAVSKRHIRYAAEYSYADGFPYGLAPEILAPGVAAILSKLLGDDDEPVERDSIFATLQKDINAFDIETEIGADDLRIHRLSLSADSKRNLLLLTHFTEAGCSSAKDITRLIKERPELLRTLPSFYTIQVAGSCLQACAICPYPRYGPGQAGARDFITLERFNTLLDKISDFSGDAVLDLSLWGELSLHPQKQELIGAALERPQLSTIIETSGLGWKTAELEALADMSTRAASRVGILAAALSWIVSLDAHDEARYRGIRGAGYHEALETVKTLTRLFPKDTYVQAIRVKDSEDDIEVFYRSWKETEAHVIIQKYDSFCGKLPDLGVSDLSPLIRRPCWHLMRDMVILLDGTVPLCREDLGALSGKAEQGTLGNVFSDELAAIWECGFPVYKQHCGAIYSGLCEKCDEYYIYNF